MLMIWRRGYHWHWLLWFFVNIFEKYWWKIIEKYFSDFGNVGKMGQVGALIIMIYRKHIWEILVRNIWEIFQWFWQNGAGGLSLALVIKPLLWLNKDSPYNIILVIIFIIIIIVVFIIIIIIRNLTLLGRDGSNQGQLAPLTTSLITILTLVLLLLMMMMMMMVVMLMVMVMLMLINYFRRLSKSSNR